MAIDMSQFFETFFEEVNDHLAEMERLLLHIDLSAPEAEDLNSIFRSAHSIKGGAGTFGFMHMAQTTHILESFLDHVRSGERNLTNAHADVILAAVDYLRGLLQVYKQGIEADEAEFQAMCERLHALDSEKDLVSQEMEKHDDSFGLFEEMLDEAAASLKDDAFGLFDEDAQTSSGASQATEQEDKSFGLFEPISSASSALATKPASTDKAAAPKAGAANAETSSIRVSVERVDQLINLVGELVITQAMLTQTGQDFEGPAYERLQNALSLLERNTRDLQESVMSIRMLPISFVFNRFPRVVRDLSQKLGKQVDLVLQGEGTEMDRGLIEKLVDPLTHLVRNSIDHGIESTEQRLAAGKSAKGVVTLNAYQRGGNIVLEVSDDGGGLNREKILAKARERGLPSADGMSDSEVWQLIFAPGFSTAEVVTDVSGRGVGMDVVKRNIGELGGRIEVSSTAGKGSCFTIRLPLTLAILDGMSIAVGKEVFIVPLTFILESLQPKEGDVRHVAGQGEVVRVRGEYLPLIHLGQILSVGGRSAPTESILLLVQSGGLKAALQVDDLLGQHQVVIKSLEANFRRVPGVSGATVMGDGHVALILDVADIVSRRSLAQAA